MSSPAFCTTMRNGVLNLLFKGTAFTPYSSGIWLALYTTATDSTGAGTEVVTSGGTLYARVDIASAFGTAATGSAGTISNTILLSFPTAGANWGTVTHWAILNSATVGAGTMLVFGSLSSSAAINTGVQATVAIGALTVTLT